MTEHNATAAAGLAVLAARGLANELLRTFVDRRRPSLNPIERMSVEALKDVVVTVKRIKMTFETYCHLGKTFDISCVVEDKSDRDEAFALSPEVALEQIHGS